MILLDNLRLQSYFDILSIYLISKTETKLDKGRSKILGKYKSLYIKMFTLLNYLFLKTLAFLQVAFFRINLYLK